METENVRSYFIAIEGLNTGTALPEAILRKKVFNFISTESIKSAHAIATFPSVIFF
jgi:hypothetical protein